MVVRAYVGSHADCRAQPAECGATARASVGPPWRQRGARSADCGVRSNPTSLRRPAVAPLRTAARGLQSAELWYEPLLALMRTAERRLRSAEEPHEPPSTHRGGSAERGLRTAERGAIARASVGNVTLQRSMRTAECSTAVQAAPQKNFKKALTADCSRHSSRLRRCAVHTPLRPS